MLTKRALAPKKAPPPKKYLPRKKKNQPPKQRPPKKKENLLTPLTPGLNCDPISALRRQYIVIYCDVCKDFVIRIRPPSGGTFSIGECPQCGHDFDECCTYSRRNKTNPCHCYILFVLRKWTCWACGFRYNQRKFVMEYLQPPYAPGESDQDAACVKCGYPLAKGGCEMRLCWELDTETEELATRKEILRMLANFDVELEFEDEVDFDDRLQALGLDF